MSNRKKPCPQNLHQGKNKPDENLSTKLGKLNGAKVIARLALPPDTDDAARLHQGKNRPDENPNTKLGKLNGAR